MSSNLFVLSVDNEKDAQEIINGLKRLQAQQLIKVDDAAVVTKDKNGKPKIRQMNDLVGAGALGGAFWGLLFGMIFFIPLVGAAIGAATGAIAGKFTDLGIDDKFIKSVGESIQPGTAALFLMTSNAVVDKVTAEMKQYKFKVIQTSLSNEDESKLREALGIPQQTV